MDMHSTTRPISAGEMVIRRLYEITSRYADGLDCQVTELLRLGCDRFDLDYGIVSRVHGNRYEVTHLHVPPGTELARGDRFRLEDTYCAVTMQADGPVGFERAGEQSIAEHPCYANFRLESYIGMPLYVGEERYGTINFSSHEARDRKFEEVDIDSLRLMGSWLSTELQRRAMEAELARAHIELASLVRTDPLTELRNRRGMAEALEDLSRRSRHGGTPLSCILVDIDDFKGINDDYGHSSGDRVIRAVADAVRGSLRPTDIASRIGGDEFLAMLPEATTEEAHRVALRIVESVDRLDLVVEGRTVPVTVSVGVAEVPTDARAVTDVIRSTEALLKRSKSEGKNRVSV